MELEMKGNYADDYADNYVYEDDGWWWVWYNHDVYGPYSDEATASLTLDRLEELGKDELGTDAA